MRNKSFEAYRRYESGSRMMTTDWKVIAQCVVPLEGVINATRPTYYKKTNDIIERLDQTE